MKKRAKVLYVAEFVNQLDRFMNGAMVCDGNGTPILGSNAKEVKDDANDLHGLRYRKSFVVVPYDRRKGW